MASNLNIIQKKDWAAMLYLKENLTQQEISDKVGVSRQTLGKWIKAEKWDERKVGITLTKEQQINSLYRQIELINKNIAGREEKQRYPDSKEADIITKLATAIKKLENDVDISSVISAGIKFIEWVRKVDYEKAKELTGLWDKFMKDSIL